MLKMTDKQLLKEVTQFTKGLLKKAKCNHAGNCYAVSHILKPYLSFFYGVETMVVNSKVKQGKKKINHYYLLRVKDGIIIDATASQFTNIDGEQMPKVFIGEKPSWY